MALDSLFERYGARKPISRIAINPVGSLIRCDICLTDIIKVGRTQKRCLECRPEYRRRWVSARKGGTVAIGAQFSCPDCQSLVTKTAPGHKRCAPCASFFRKGKVTRSRLSKGIPHLKMGATISCEACSSALVRTGANSRYCAPCKLTLGKLRARLHAESKARANGVQKVKGTSIFCLLCGEEFIRSGIRAKFCKGCAKDAWKLCPRRRLNLGVANGIRKSLGGSKGRRSWQTLVGFSFDDLRAHLEKQFSRGMSWENWGDWHVDHILPLSSFHFDGPDDPEFRAAWALTNLRPLWARANLAKNNKRTLLL